MLFMIIEHFKDVAAIGERFRAKGRMLPEGVIYQASWIDAAANRCFQLMEAPHEESLRPWLAAWNDLTDFEVVPVTTSAEFWSTRKQGCNTLILHPLRRLRRHPLAINADHKRAFYAFSSTALDAESNITA
jgi:Protein of unknown function (DUF3303)